MTMTITWAPSDDAVLNKDEMRAFKQSTLSQSIRICMATRQRQDAISRSLLPFSNEISLLKLMWLLFFCFSCWSVVLCCSSDTNPYAGHAVVEQLKLQPSTLTAVKASKLIIQ